MNYRSSVQYANPPPKKHNYFQTLVKQWKVYTSRQTSRDILQYIYIYILVAKYSKPARNKKYTPSSSSPHPKMEYYIQVSVGKL